LRASVTAKGIVRDCGGKHGKGDGGLCGQLQWDLRRRQLSGRCCYDLYLQLYLCIFQKIHLKK
jgi:hypothetical protein